MLILVAVLWNTLFLKYSTIPEFSRHFPFGNKRLWKVPFSNQYLATAPENLSKSPK